MNTNNIHHFPINLALLVMFGFLAVLPFSSFYLFKVEQNSPILGTSSSIVDNVTLTVSNTAVTNFKYSITSFEEKTIKVKGSQVFLKDNYPNLNAKVINGNLILTNTSPNNYLVEGVVY